MSSLSIASSDVAVPTSSTFPSSPSSASSSSYSASHLLRVLVPDLMSLVLAHLNQRDFISAQQICCTFHRASSMSTSTPRQLDIARIIAMVRHASDAYPSYTQPTWKDDAQENILYHRTLTDSMRIFAPRRSKKEVGDVPIIPASTRSIALWDDLYLSEVNAFMQSIQNHGRVEVLIEVSPGYSSSRDNSHVPRAERVGLPKNNNEEVRTFFSAIAESLRVLITHTTFNMIDLSPLTRLRVLCVPSVGQMDHLDEMHELESLEVDKVSDGLMRKVRWLSSHYALTSFTTRESLSPENLGFLCGFTPYEVDNHVAEAMLQAEEAEIQDDHILDGNGHEIVEKVRDPSSSAFKRLHHIKSDRFLHVHQDERMNQPICKLSHIGFTIFTGDSIDNYFLCLLSVHLPHINSISAPGFNTRLHQIFSPVLVMRRYMPLLQLTPEHEVYMKERLAKMRSVTIRYDRATSSPTLTIHYQAYLSNEFPSFSPSLTRLHIHDFDHEYISNTMLQTAFKSMTRLECLTIQPTSAHLLWKYDRDTISQSTFLGIKHLSSLRVLSLCGADIRLLWNSACFSVLAALPHFESWQITSKQNHDSMPVDESLELSEEMLKLIASSLRWRSIIFTSHEVDDWYLAKKKRTPKDAIDHELQQLTPHLLQILNQFRVEFNQHEYRIRQEEANNTNNSNSPFTEYHWLRVWDGARRRFAPKQTKQQEGGSKSRVEASTNEETQNCRCVVC